MSELRKAHALAEAEKARMKEEIGTLKAENRKAKKSEIERLGAENDLLREKAGQVETIGSRCLGLEEMLEMATLAYQHLYARTVSRTEYERMQEELREEGSKRLIAEGRTHALEADFQSMREKRNELRERLKLCEDERRRTSQTVDDLLVERRHSQTDMVSTGQHIAVDELLFDASSSPDRRLLGLTLTHVALATSHLHHQLIVLSSENDDSRSNLKSTSSALSTAQTDLSTLRSQLLHLQSIHSALETAHSTCAGTITQLRADRTQATHSLDSSKRFLEEAKLDLRRVEEKARVDRESLKRANDGAMRWKYAETALEEEIALFVSFPAPTSWSTDENRLRHAVDDARRFEELYNELLGSHRLLESREAIAIEEAERVVAQNADLIGGSNGNGSGLQRISYVEAVRQEMAIVKQVNLSDPDVSSKNVEADEWIVGAGVDPDDAEHRE